MIWLHEWLKNRMVSSVLHFPAVFQGSQAELAWGKQPGEHKLARMRVQAGRSMVTSVPFCFPPVLNLCFVPGGCLSSFPPLVVPFQNPAKALLLALAQEEFRRMNRHEGPKATAPFPCVPAVSCPLPSESHPRVVSSARVTFPSPTDSSRGASHG